MLKKFTDPANEFHSHTCINNRKIFLNYVEKKLTSQGNEFLSIQIDTEA